MKRIIVIFVSIVLAMPLTAIAQDNSSSLGNLSNLQTKYNISLDDPLKANVIATCDAQKQKIKTTLTQNDGAISKRMIAYSEIQKEVKALEIRISRQGTDASELDLFIGSLDQQIDELRKVGQEYSNVANDLLFIDCKQNPELFVAGLEELRGIKNRTLTIASGLKNTIINSPESTFKPLIERLLI
jgi:archaellum component FlaC